MTYGAGRFDAVLGGGLEYAIARRATHENGLAQLADDGEYYEALQREVPDCLFSRAATIAVISDTVVLPDWDWSPRSHLIFDDEGGYTRAPDMSELGFENLGLEEPLRRHDYVKEAVVGGAFRPETLKRIGRVRLADAESEERKILFARIHVSRLLAQIEAAQKGLAHLFIPADDIAVLRELAAYAMTKESRPPFDMPDVDGAVPADARSVTLLSFEPPDTKSIGAVRRDKDVRRYSEAIHRLWEIEDPVEREKACVDAMRKTLSGDSFTGRVSKVVEYLGWFLKPLGWAGVPLVSALADSRDGGAALLDRYRRRTNWLLIRPSMNQTALEDYLKRTENY